MTLRERMPAPWRRMLTDPSSLDRVEAFLAQEAAQGHCVQPGSERIFRALELVEPEQVKVVITAQDPYPGAGVPTGLAFSVADDAALPQSLRNIYREYSEDLGYPIPRHGDLSPWARQGVLLLNAALTCRVGQAGSHSRCGWHEVTSQLLSGLYEQNPGLVFLCWGRPALRLAERLDIPGSQLLASAHPSPLSARRGFFGSRPFSSANRMLAGMGAESIDWRL